MTTVRASSRSTSAATGSSAVSDPGEGAGLSSSGAPAATATPAALVCPARSPAAATTTTGARSYSARDVAVARVEAPPPSTCTPVGRASAVVGAAVARADGAVSCAVSSGPAAVQAVRARAGTSSRACARDMGPLEGCGGAQAGPAGAGPRVGRAAWTGPVTGRAARRASSYRSATVPRRCGLLSRAGAKPSAALRTRQTLASRTPYSTLEPMSAAVNSTCMTTADVALVDTAGRR